MGGGEGRKGSGWSGLAGWGTGRGDDGHTSGQPPLLWVEPYPSRLWSNSNSGTASGSAGFSSPMYQGPNRRVSWKYLPVEVLRQKTLDSGSRYSDVNPILWTGSARV